MFIYFTLFLQQIGAKKPAKAPVAKKAHLRGKHQKKKVALKFTIDCTHPVEDNIMDVASFVSFICNIYSFIRIISHAMN